MYILIFTHIFICVEHHGQLLVVEEGEKKKMSLALEDILVFATGAAHVPPMGWSEQPRIEFKKEYDLPSASTCSNCLYIPTTNADNYDAFKYKFAFAVNCAVGFGQV